ncbi:unnamed protein product, partial [Heterotrigona itama]
KHVRKILCPRIKSKKQKEVLCPENERKGSCKQIEDACCTSKRMQSVTCPFKQMEKKCIQGKTCSGRERKTSSRCCPKYKSNRIQKLEYEVYQLRKEIECMKYERKEAEKAIQKAILSGTRILGGRFKSTVDPGSIEKFVNICNSNASFQSACPVTLYTKAVYHRPLRYVTTKLGRRGKNWIIAKIAPISFSKFRID